MKLFDAHFHIIDLKYPLVANKGYLPAEFTVEDYLSKTKSLNIQAGAVVSGSFQATDQSYLVAALKTLGPNFVGVTQLKADVSDSEILELHKKGIRAVRFNLFRGSSEDVSKLAGFAQRIYDTAGWHVELYIDSNELTDLMPILFKLPKVSIDHLGLSKSGLPNLFKCVEKGIKVKATGFMRVNFDVLQALKQINKINPNTLMFGTDLPGTRASRQFSIDDLKLIQDNFDTKTQQKILWQNAANFYGI